MKRSLLLLSLFYICPTLFAQNLVPNPSFEQYDNCPTGFGQIVCPLNSPPFKPTVTDWVTPVPNSPDYYNACSKSIYATVPTHYHGTYPAHTGDAYVAIAAHSGFLTNGPSSSYREYIEVKLLQPLVAGEQYVISCYVRIAFKKDPQYTPNIIAVDEIGVHVSKTQVTSFTHPLNQNYTSMQDTFKQPLNDQTGWTKISGIYTATGGEEWITIGVFNFSNTHPNFTQVYPTAVVPNQTYTSYYLVDDVSLVKKPKCDTITKTTDTILCNHLSLPVTLNSSATNATYTWNTAANTASISAPSVGTYWCSALEGCNLTVDSFTLSLNKDTTHTKIDTTACKGESINITSRDNAISYLWSTNETSKTISVNKLGKYWCTSQVGCKQYIDSFNVEDRSFYVDIDLGKDIYTCSEERIKLGKLFAGNKTYSWNTGENTCCISPTQSGTYILTVSDECSVLKDSINIDFYNCNDCFSMPNVFTPNKDGRNDAIKPIPRCDIDKYLFRIYNRWGELVFETKDINERWDGTYKNESYKTSTFFYYIQYTLMQDPNTKTISGDILLLR
ncbi:MAG: gliding motility-associated C-terminal domain-containing protein [Flavipsychrobacter sp.]